MRDMIKFKQDEEKGLRVKSARASSKGLTTTIVASAINRAMRRGRISQDTAYRCSVNWHKDLAKRPKSIVWSLVANSELLEAARFRKMGKLDLAKVTLNNAKNSLMLSRAMVSIQSSH